MFEFFDLKKIEISHLFKVLIEWLSGLAILFALLWLGDFLSSVLGNVLPGSIIGMLLLTLLLYSGILPLHWVQRSANFFIKWMSLLFVPIGVGLVDHLMVLQGALFALVATCVFGTLALLAVSGWAAEYWYSDLRNKAANKHGANSEGNSHE